MVTTATVNFRKTAELVPTNIIKQLIQGTTVTVTAPGLSGTYNWTPVTANGVSGFISGNYLKNP